MPKQLLNAAIPRKPRKKGLQETSRHNEDIVYKG